MHKTNLAIFHEFGDMGAMAKQDDYVRYTIRVPADLYAQLQSAAGEKSVNAEIVARLERSFAEYMTLSDHGLEQVLKQASAVTTTLWEMMFFQREVELDGYIADQAKQGRIMTKPEAIAHILREYLKERGYVFEPPDRRPGLIGAFKGGAVETVNALVDLRGVQADPEKTPEIMVALQESARKAVEKKLAALEKSGQIRRPKGDE